MNRKSIRADSFILPVHNLRVFRIRHQDGSTVLSLCREFTVQYLQNIQAERLQAIKYGR